MPVTALSDNKQSVKVLLMSGIQHAFLIPEYQRPYAWTFDQVDTLFSDIWDFTESTGGPEREATYFLGSIVSFINEKGEQEIIDGQQRITSLFLLLRAIYEKLTKGAQTEESKNFIKQIEQCIWRANKLTGKVNKNEILIRSEVVSKDGNAILQSVLETGSADPKAKDSYSQNYLRFQKLFDDASSSSPLMIYNFLYALLNQAVLLPITADDQDTALTIFSTLNDRGMPLSDADIFKAKIYNQVPKNEKDQFIENWKDLDERASYAGESIQQLFYYYMFYIRAKENDSNSTTPGVRKYFLANKAARLYETDLMDNLRVILGFWIVVAKHEPIEDESWSTNIDILHALDILTSYPNEYWKYPVLTYYLSHRKEPQFEEHFLVFLRNLIYYLLTRYLIAPTINAVKADILKLDVEITQATLPRFTFRDIDLSQLSASIKSPNRNAVRMMLKIIAYLDDAQDGLLPASWEIEHIFPQKWQSSYFTNIPDDVIRDKIEHIGNKLPFEKRLNIVAGNGYFGKKKESYAKSRIAVTKRMTNSPIHEWSLDDITERDAAVAELLRQGLERWNADYQHMDQPSETAEDPTPEQLEMIRKFRENGWI